MVKKYRFTASWCQPCKALAQKVEQFGITGITVVDVDTDLGKELMGKYEIRSVPTIVLDYGDTFNKYSGAQLSAQAWATIAE